MPVSPTRFPDTDLLPGSCMAGVLNPSAPYSGRDSRNMALVCSVKCTVCSVEWAVHSVQCVVCSLQCAVCIVW